VISKLPLSWFRPSQIQTWPHPKILGALPGEVEQRSQGQDAIEPRRICGSIRQPSDCRICSRIPPKKIPKPLPGNNPIVPDNFDLHNSVVREKWTKLLITQVCVPAAKAEPARPDDPRMRSKSLQGIFQPPLFRNYVIVYKPIKVRRCS